jgi:hypothetical protein
MVRMDELGKLPVQLRQMTVWMTKARFLAEAGIYLRLPLTSLIVQ